MTEQQGPDVVLDTAFFRRWLDHATRAIVLHADYLTELDSAIGDADHGINLRRGFTAGSAVVADNPPETPGALLTAFGTRLTSTVGGASGPLYGTVLRHAGRTLGNESSVTPRALGEALAAAVAGVRRLGDSGPGDKTMVDALAPAAEAYGAAVAGGATVADALASAASAARAGAEATIPMRARRGRASYLGERSIGHKDPGATSSAVLIAALYEVSISRDQDVPGPKAEAREAPAGAQSTERAGAQPGGGEEAQETATGEEKAASRTEGRVGVVLVAHTRDLAVATADLAGALTGSGRPASVAAAGGRENGSIGTSAALIRRAINRVDAGHGVVVLCDMGSAVLTVKVLLSESGQEAPLRTVCIADAPFVEGAVGAVVAASTGADLDMVVAAAEGARDYHKV